MDLREIVGICLSIDGGQPEWTVFGVLFFRREWLRAFLRLAFASRADCVCPPPAVFVLCFFPEPLLAGCAVLASVPRCKEAFGL